MWISIGHNHIVSCSSLKRLTLSLKTSSNYWSLHSVVCFDNIVASLPFTEWYFRSFGNAFPDTIHFNVPNPPPFKCIRQVVLCEYDGPLSLALFKFVERLFTRIDHLCISNGCCLQKFDWTLLPRFPKITTMALGLYYKSCDMLPDSPLNAASLRAFFSIVPNLRRLQTSTNFLKEHETVLHADQQLQDVAKRIEEVQMIKYENKQMEEFVISFFPNAKLRFDYRPNQFF
ncbi:unnamed protein product [Rotaria sp. Silwood2]|nr:unnamed protein product [Rotaria sp. Silwood2]CAF2859502.1 unnamed protein product [Rotaria sp. Silwood2]